MPGKDKVVAAVTPSRRNRICQGMRREAPWFVLQADSLQQAKTTSQAPSAPLLQIASILIIWPDLLLGCLFKKLVCRCLLYILYYQVNEFSRTSPTAPVPSYKPSCLPLALRLRSHWVYETPRHGVPASFFPAPFLLLSLCNLHRTSTF